MSRRSYVEYGRYWLDGPGCRPSRPVKCGCAGGWNSTGSGAADAFARGRGAVIALPHVGVGSGEERGWRSRHALTAIVERIERNAS